MSDIRALVDQFVAQLEAAIRQEALQTLRDALEGGPSTARSSRGSSKPSNGASKPSNGASKPSKAADITQKRRTANDIEAEANRLLVAIKAKPGSTSEELKKAARVLPKDFSLPIQKLLAEKRIKKKGEKRATKYFPA